MHTAKPISKKIAYKSYSYDPNFSIWIVTERTAYSTEEVAGAKAGSDNDTIEVRRSAAIDDLIYTKK